MSTVPTPAADTVLNSIDALCDAYAKAKVAYTVANHADTKTERDHHIARSQYWNSEAQNHYSSLTEAIHTLAPDRTHVETFLPVRVLPNGHVEIHTRDQHGRQIVVVLTTAEAVAIGVHLTAHAAASLDRTGTMLHRILPPLPTQPPVATTHTPTTPANGGDTQAIGRASAPQ